MSATPPQTTDPVDLVRQLDPDAIRDRLEALDRERDALRVLLRAANRARRDEPPTANHRRGAQP
jgi:hypothetical protein